MSKIKRCKQIDFIFKQNLRSQLFMFPDFMLRYAKCLVESDNSPENSPLFFLIKKSLYCSYYLDI